MNILRESMAGSLESSDILVRVSPGKGALDITVNSIVFEQFGIAIQNEVKKTLEKLGVTDALVAVEDKGALDCVIRARVQAVVARATDVTPEWSAL